MPHFSSRRARYDAMMIIDDCHDAADAFIEALFRAAACRQLMLMMR